MAELKDLIQTALDPEAGSFRRRMAVLDFAKGEDPAVVDALMQLLGDKDEYMRREVVSALAKRPEDAAIDPLIKALGDDDDTVQRYAADALGERSVARAIGPLEALAEDNSYSVRDASKRAIEQIRRNQPMATSVATSADAPAPIQTAEPITPAAPTIAKPVTPAPAVAAPPVPTVAPPVIEAEMEELPVETSSAEVLSPQEPAEEFASEVPEPPSTAQPEPIAAEIVYVETAAEEPRVELVQPDEVAVVPATVEQSSEAPPPQPTDVDIVPAELVADVPLRKLPWARAERMRVFFGDELPRAKRLYETIAASRDRQLKGEIKHQKSLMTLGMERADKEDDLARLQEATETAQQRMQKLQHQSTQKLKEKHRLKQDAASMWNQMSGSIFPDRKAEQDRQIQQLDTELDKLRGKIDEAREELASLGQQHQRLAGPMAELRGSVERLTKARDTAAQRLVKLERKLEKLILEILQALTDDQWQARLDRLAGLSKQGDYLRGCMGQLQTAMRCLHAEAADAQRVEAALVQAKEAAESSLETLGTALADGFQVSANEKETAVRLSGAVRFQEDHSFFGGYSGASGSARGSGSGHASYVVEQIEWRPTGQLHQRVSALTDAWSVCGEQTAKLEILSALRTVRRRHISEYVHFLRTELERDFQQEPR